MRSNESLHGLYTCLNGFCIKSFLTANKTAAKQNISYLKLARNSERGMSGSKIVEGNPARGLEARPGLLLSGGRGGAGRGGAGRVAAGRSPASSGAVGSGGQRPGPPVEARACLFV